MLYVSMPAISLLAARGESTKRPLKRPQGYSRGSQGVLKAVGRHRAESTDQQISPFYASASGQALCSRIRSHGRSLRRLTDRFRSVTGSLAKW